MAHSQTEMPTESLEDVLAQANKQAQLPTPTESLPIIDIENPDEMRKLAKSVLVEIVQMAPRNVSLVGAIRELLDRIDGKAPQSVSMIVKTSPVGKLTDDEIIVILANLPNNPMIIPPMPK